MYLARKTAWLSVWCVLLPWLVSPSLAQELEPRRWTHLPIDTNFAAVGYAYTEADISIDPVLRLEGARLDKHTWFAGYIRTFELAEKSARIDLVQSWQEGRWTGLLNGPPASANRQGWSDTIVRFAVNLVGAPPLAGKEYAAYRAATDVETLVGASLVVRLPTGQYKKDKLLNLGGNRFSIKPMLGVIHNRGKWSFEMTGDMSMFTDNDSFFNGNTLEQDPLYTLQAHVIHTFRPGLWLAASAGYGAGGQTSVNGVKSNNRKENVGWAISAGYPIARWLSIKAAYIGTRSQTFVGSDTDTLTIGFSTFW